VTGQADLPPLTRGQLLTAEQLAERWQVPPAHVYRLAREGRVPVVRLGRYRRFRVDAIEAFEMADARDHPYDGSS
jgi:excisionase family DNA binding protein